MKTMRLLKPSGFIDSIEYTSEVILKLLGVRKPQSYRLSNSQLVEPKYYFKMKRLSGS